MRQYKYIHLFIANDIKFNPRIAKMLCEQENGFELEEHLLVTPFDRVYSIFREIKKDNPKLSIELYQTNISLDANDISIVDYYAVHCKWLFLHGIFPIQNSVLIKNKHCKKIIWRTWGNNVDFPHYDYSVIKKLVLYLIEWYWKKKVRKFYAIGIGNLVDKINITDQFGDVKTFYMPYPLPGGKDMIEMARKRKKEQSGYLNIMVGHSGHQEDCHIQIMEDLSHLKDKPIHLYFVLSYGKEEYICKIEKYIEENWREKATVIKEFLTYDKYVNLLNQMDIAILDSERSYALGNIAILIGLKKKIFLNRKGILKRAFEIEKIPFCFTDTLKNITYEELLEPLDFSRCGPTDLHRKSYREEVEEWKYMLSSLE